MRFWHAVPIHPCFRDTHYTNVRTKRIMSHPTHPNDNSDSSPEELEKKVVNLWFAVAVIGLFVFACFYVLKVAIDLFLPIVLASFLGFLLTPVTRWLKKIGFSHFWAPLLSTLSFLFLLICLCVRNRANRSPLFYFGDADQCCFGIECLDFRGFPGAATSIALGRRRIFAPLYSLRGSDRWYRCHDARFADSFRLGLVRPFATSRVSFMCNDRRESGDAAVSWTLVSLKPYRHPVDFSSLVLPMGRGRYSAGCSPPCDLQNILRSY